MSKRSKIGLRNSRFRDFSIFLLLSFLAWMITRLSETYVYEIRTQIRMTQAPENLILVGEAESVLPVKIRTSGFQLMRYQLLPKIIDLNLDAVVFSGSQYYLPLENVSRQISDQLPLGSSVLQVPSDTLFVNLQRLETKTVPVRAELNLQLAQNFMLDSTLVVRPEQIQMVGPAEEIDSIQELRTLPATLQDVDADFDMELPLEVSGTLQKTRLSNSKVRVSGTVFRFSEVLVEVPVTVQNLPQDLRIKTFPPTLPVLCRGRVEAIKNLMASDFSIVADFEHPDPVTGRLQVTLHRFPARIHSAVLLEESVEFIVRRQ